MDCVLPSANHRRAKGWIKKTRLAMVLIFLLLKYQHFQTDLYKYGSFSSDRYAKYYKENNVEKRTLIKVFGIRFDILVFGTVSLCSQPLAPPFLHHVLIFAVVPQGVNAGVIVISWQYASPPWDKRRGRGVFEVLSMNKSSDEYKGESGRKKI